MTIFISILGLGLLVSSAGSGISPRRSRSGFPPELYIGFPPATVKRTRNGIEYRIGSSRSGAP